MQTITLTKTEDGRTVEFPALCPDKLQIVLEQVTDAGRGQFAFVQQHVSGLTDPKCTRKRVSDKWVLVKPRYDRYLERKMEALRGLQFDMVSADSFPQKLIDKAEATGKTLRELFDTAKSELLASGEASEAGRDTRTGYGSFNGVTVHLRTAKDGKQTILLADPATGLPVVDSIMLYWYSIKEREHVKGEYKPTNSHAKTLMKNYLESLAVARPWRSLSLGLNNFAAVHFGGKKVLGMVNDLLSAQEDAELSRVFREASYIAMLGPLTPLEALQNEAEAETEQKA